MAQFFFNGLMLVPLGLLVYTAVQMHGRSRNRKVMVPVGAAGVGVARPPGETVHAKLEAMDEEVGDLLFGIAALLVTATYLGLAFDRSFADPLQKSVALLAVVAVPVPLHLRKLRALQGIEQARKRLRLGFETERYTAQHLGGFLRWGGEVFHDFPAGDGGVIDHVLVVPHGIFTFESKGCETPVAEPGRKYAVASYDGHAIHFPGQRCTAALVQAKRHARHVQTVLAGRLGHQLPVCPAVALPGWEVELGTPRRSHVVQVLNPEDTRAMIEALVPQPVYGAEHIRAIAHALDEHSRSAAADSGSDQRPARRQRRPGGRDGDGGGRREVRTRRSGWLSKLMPARRRRVASADRKHAQPARPSGEVDPVTGGSADQG